MQFIYELMDGMTLGQVALLIIGVILFILFIPILVNKSLKDKPIKHLIWIFIGASLMVIFPSIKKIEYNGLRAELKSNRSGTTQQEISNLKMQIEMSKGRTWSEKEKVSIKRMEAKLKMLDQMPVHVPPVHVQPVPVPPVHLQPVHLQPVHVPDS